MLRFLDGAEDKSADTLIINSSQLLTLEPLEEGQKTGNERSQYKDRGLSYISQGAVAIKDGLILETGTTSEIMQNYPDCPDVIDSDHSLVMPGFVDCHTHLVFAGERSKEMEQRLEGMRYLDILASGGGIHSTVRSTR